MKNKFVKQGCHSSLINELLERVSLLNRIDLISEDTRQKPDRIPLAITYNQFLPNITKTIRESWNTLKINENFKEIFKNEIVTAFDKNIRGMIGTYGIENGWGKKDLKTLKEGITPCRPKAGNTCCKQIKTTIFYSQQTKNLGRYFKIQIAKQNVPFILWSVQYATYSMSVKTRHNSTLDWTITETT